MAADDLFGADSNPRQKVYEFTVAADLVGDQPRLVAVRRGPGPGVTTYTWVFDPPATDFDLRPLEEEVPFPFQFSPTGPEGKPLHLGDAPSRLFVLQAKARNPMPVVENQLSPMT